MRPSSSTRACSTTSSTCCAAAMWCRRPPRTARLRSGMRCSASPRTRSSCFPNKSGTTSCRLLWSLSEVFPVSRVGLLGSMKINEPACAPLPLGAGAALFRFDAALFRRGGGPRLLADLGLDERRPYQCREPFQRRAPILLLAAFTTRAEQEAPVLEQLLSREAAQPISGGDRQAGIERQQEAQLHRARDLVDVLTAGPRGADEFPCQFLVGNRNVRGDRERHGARLLLVGVRGRRVYADLALRHRYRDLVLLEQGPDGSIDLGAH